MAGCDRYRKAMTLLRRVASSDADLAIGHVSPDAFVQHNPCVADGVVGHLTEPASKAERSGREEFKWLEVDCVKEETFQPCYADAWKPTPPSRTPFSSASSFPASMTRPMRQTSRNSDAW